MQIDLYELFSASDALVVFAIIAIGYLVGNAKIGRFQLGATGGVLLCALVFGHYGFKGDPVVQSIGFTLFIYCVGLQAGPQFFNVMRLDGPRYITLTIFVAVVSVVLVVALAAAVGLESSLSAGLLAGALTSTPTLVGAQNAVHSGIAAIPAGSTADDVMQSISVGYAITYVFGTVGLLILVKVLPMLLRVDLVDEAHTFAIERGIREGPAKPQGRRPILRAYLVEDERFVGKTLAQIQADRDRSGGDRGALYKLKRGNAIIDPITPETVIEHGDKVAVFGSPEQHASERERFHLGPEVLDEDLVDAVIELSEVVVTTDRAVGRSLGDLGVLANYGCFVAKVTRSQIELPLNAHTVLQKGDVMTVSGERSFLERLVADLGSEELKVTETDLVTFAFGIVAGLFLGQITIKVGTVDVGLGSAGGLLLAGILVGFIRANRPTFGRVPPAARFILMELGLMLFMVGVGLNAGSGIVEALLTVGPTLFLCGVVVTITPLVTGYLFGRLLLRMNPAVLFGALTGAMTSTPALGIVQQAAKSATPALGYAGTYALANVLLTIAGTIVMLL